MSIFLLKNPMNGAILATAFVFSLAPLYIHQKYDHQNLASSLV